MATEEKLKFKDYIP